MLGSVLAAVIAVALSPLSPLGPVRPVYPDRGLSWDWTVLGFGVLALTRFWAASPRCWRTRPRRTAWRPGPDSASTSGARVVASAARAGLSAPGVVGVRMALEPGEGRAAVPVRSALLGSVLAVALVVTTLTFGSSLHTLVSDPPLYGWNWTYILNPVGSGGGDVPQVALTMLKHDKDVAAYTGASYNDLEMDGQEVPFLIENAGATVTPPILSGHGVEGRNRSSSARPRWRSCTSTSASTSPSPTARRRRAHLRPADAASDRRHGHVPRHRLRQHGLGSHVHGHRRAHLRSRCCPRRLSPPSMAGPIPHSAGRTWCSSGSDRDVPHGRRAGEPPPYRRGGRPAFASARGDPAGNAIVVQGVQRPAEIVNYRTIGLTPLFWSRAWRSAPSRHWR